MSGVQIRKIFIRLEKDLKVTLHRRDAYHRLCPGCHVDANFGFTAVRGDVTVGDKLLNSGRASRLTFWGNAVKKYRGTTPPG